MFAVLFENFMSDLEEEDRTSQIYKNMLDLDWISPQYRESVSHAELVRDFISGTDR